MAEITTKLVDQLNTFLKANHTLPVTLLVGDFRNNTGESLQLSTFREELEITLIANVSLAQWIDPTPWLAFRHATSLGGYERRQFFRSTPLENLPFEFVLFGDIQVNSSSFASDRRYIIRLYLVTPAVRGGTLTVAEFFYTRS